ncbi:MAG: glycosyltransferase family 2 protein [Actinobacteria bacterium]|nr:glycosyltransferase family 2 protein [Actinomycetota bacterium]
MEGSDGPAVAVVVVDYDAGDHLLRCLESVHRHAGDASLEVVVVDNASRDGSAEAAGEAHPGVRVLRNAENQGFARAANRGIRETSAPFVLLLNPDAEIAAGTLSGLRKLALDRPRAGVIGPMIRGTDGEPYLSGRRVPGLGEALGHVLLGPFLPGNRFTRAYTMADWDRTTERGVDWISGSAMFLRREALEEVGDFDERFFMYAEDVDICTRLRAAGWKVLFSPEVEVRHVGGVATRRDPRMPLEHSRSAYRYFAKHHAGGWRAVLLPLAWVALRIRAAVVARSWGRR